MGALFRHRGQSGNVVLIVMFGLFLLGLGGGAWFIFSPSPSDETARAAMDARAAYDEAVLALDKAMNDPRNVEASIDRNASFQCLFSRDGMCQGMGGGFLLYEYGKANHPLSHLAKDAGSDVNGAPCKGFPSKECPLRVETAWEPVCGGSRCEGTKSLKVKAKVTLAPIHGTEAPLMWTKDGLFTPVIQLSQATQCARGGGEWNGKECLTPGQVADRRMPAGSSGVQTQAVNATETSDPRLAQEAPQPVQQVVYECPNQIVVQGQYFPVQFLSADRGQVSVPAMSCPSQGYFDVFVFQCAAKSPPTFPNEGQWIQVEAVMAPACGQDGQPTNNLPTRF